MRTLFDWLVAIIACSALALIVPPIMDAALAHPLVAVLVVMAAFLVALWKRPYLK